MEWQRSIRWRELGRDRLDELAARGLRRRSFFPHRFVFLPRPGPDGYKLAARMCGRARPDSLWELVLFADESMLAEFPHELFFDDDVVWHQQHLGRLGQVAYADVVVDGDEAWSMSHVSDLVQRIGRRREHKTRIENRFKGWPDLVVHALLAFATERGLRRLRIPTAALQMQHTDRARTVQPELFERVYDRSVNRVLRASRDGEWWLADVEQNRDRLTVPVVRVERLEPAKVVCLAHDVEAGLGHRGIDERRAELADRTWRASVAGMLAAERGAGVRATYNVVGRLLPEVRLEIEADGHCVAFHSFDHTVESTRQRVSARLSRRRRNGRPALQQLQACRELDYRLKGYRVPQSRLTAELTPENLLFHNFEWLANSANATGRSTPELTSGLVQLPVHLDDFDLYRRRTTFDEWLVWLRERIAEHGVVVVSLHDCYADLWLDRYPALLAELQGLGDLRTLDEVAADVALAAAE